MHPAIAARREPLSYRCVSTAGELVRDPAKPLAEIRLEDRKDLYQALHRSGIGLAELKRRRNPSTRGGSAATNGAARRDVSISCTARMTSSTCTRAIHAGRGGIESLRIRRQELPHRLAFNFVTNVS